MDKQKFEQIIYPLIELRAKGYKRPWDQLSQNEQQDASLIVNSRPREEHCEDCDRSVVGRRVSIFHNNFVGTHRGRTRTPAWVKKCELCGLRQKFSK